MRILHDIQTCPGMAQPRPMQEKACFIPAYVSDSVPPPIFKVTFTRPFEEMFILKIGKRTFRKFGNKQHPESLNLFNHKHRRKLNQK